MMKIKNGNQYKILKSQDGGGNNAFKNFTIQVENNTEKCYNSFSSVF